MTTSLGLPVLASAAETRSIVERVNVLVRDRNLNRTNLTVAGLPSAATAGAGARGYVTDATVTTFASVVAGTGANAVPVYSDGTNWRIG